MDIRRTILWMIFSLSLLLLWNNWQVHNGKASLFGPTPAAQQADANNASPAQPAADTSIPAAVQQAQPSAAQTAGDAHVPDNTQPAATSEKIHISTDVYNLTFDTQGAQLVRAELLHYSDTDNNGQPMVLLDDSATSTYLAQSGIVGAPAGESFPTHLTPLKLVSTERSLTGDTLDVVFEAQSG